MSCYNYVLLQFAHGRRAGHSMKDAPVRQMAASRAVRLLEQVAAGTFNIEEPDSPTLETTEAPRPSIEARRRHFYFQGEFSLKSTE